MQVLSHENYRHLLDFLPSIKPALKEWQLVDVRLVETEETFTVTQAAALMQELFKDKEGKIYLCNEREIFMILHWGEANPLLIPRRVEAQLPPGSCTVTVHPPTPEGLRKLEIQIQYSKAMQASSYAAIRGARRENVVLVADDDLYMRALVKKGLAATAAIYEAEDGNEVLAAYKKCLPDVLFLDIHLPGRDGTQILSDILAIDPEAYVVMFSADSSQDNVEHTVQRGAKGFMTKPFSKERLMEYLEKCPTIS
ncbi:MAG: response regulator [Proteobacteria bacterium]|nr:response regulator [Pseudomonadota bacterium]